MSLHLVLKYKWFDQIDSGEKTVENRNNTSYWRKRIIEKNHKTVIFHRGYTNTTMKFKIAYVEENWWIKIHLGERLE